VRYQKLPAAFSGPARGQMDQRIESFLGDVLGHAVEEPDAVREGVRVALAKCEANFRCGSRRSA
jgi:hypothetical protein